VQTALAAQGLLPTEQPSSASVQQQKLQQQQQQQQQQQRGRRYTQSRQAASTAGTVQTHTHPPLQALRHA
jgi:hypothetical protein